MATWPPTCGSRELRHPAEGSRRLLHLQDLLRPPPQADEKEAPVLEKLRRFALGGVADKLQHPADSKHRDRDLPEAWHEQRHDKQRQRQRDRGDAKRMAQAVEPVLVAVPV